MIVHSRQAEILRHLQQQPEWSMDDLQDAIGVSRSTLRRDLLELEELGEVVRVHGGVLHPQFVRGEVTMHRRRQENLTAKQAIAAAAAERIPEGATVFVDAGSTALEVGRLLLDRDDLQLITNSVPLLAEAERLGTSASIMSIGGTMRPGSGALTGGLAVAWANQLHCDIAVVAASGLDARGLTTTELEETAIKQAILQGSAEAMLVCDASKWDRPATVRFAAWSCIHTWITDAPSRVRQSVSRRGPTVVGV